MLTKKEYQITCAGDVMPSGPVCIAAATAVCAASSACCRAATSVASRSFSPLAWLCSASNLANLCNENVRYLA